MFTLWKIAYKRNFQKNKSFLQTQSSYRRKGGKMKKFEAYLKALLKAVFKEYPYSKEKAKMSFEKVKIISKNIQKGEGNGI